LLRTPSTSADRARFPGKIFGAKNCSGRKAREGRKSKKQIEKGKEASKEKKKRRGKEWRGETMDQS
jgi:hypothetical protein